MQLLAAATRGSAAARTAWPMNSRPISTITTPAIWRSSWRLSWSVCPSPVAVMPSATNMAVKDRQNSSAGPSTFILPRPSWMSANETPEIVDR